MKTKEEILRIIQEENVRYIKLQFTDMLGTIKSVELPISQIEDVLTAQVMFDGSSIEGFVRIKEADMYLVPDLDTFLILPLESNGYGKVARMICDVHLPNGLPFAGDPRSNLKRIIQKMRSYGLHDINIGLEPEFYLFRQNEKEEPILDFSDQASYFDMAPIDGSETCRHDIVLELEKLGMVVEASHHEVGPGQNEINFRFSGALATCDNVQTFKQVVKQVARKHHLHASFMPKPALGMAGNGMHTNCSLTDQAGNNLFFDSNSPSHLSDICLQWMSGILKHARSMSAITNPIVNSYKRLVPGYEAPCYICWSDANRSSMIRIPAVRGKATRAELRNVDCAANPYLMIAAIISAGLDGIQNKLPIVAPVYDNIFEYTREEREQKGILNLPENLKDAIKELKKSDLMRETLGEHIYQKYIQAKELEWDEYRKLIHAWEWKRYF
ncbi:MAG: type I glutamate--ammonia ligase [Bacilli bacterium]|nr:type I glutamate--ammonia ligase [Bacilli bacterium]